MPTERKKRPHPGKIEESSSVPENFEFTPELGEEESYGSIVTDSHDGSESEGYVGPEEAIEGDTMGNLYFFLSSFIFMLDHNRLLYCIGTFSEKALTTKRKSGNTKSLGM